MKEDSKNNDIEPKPKKKCWVCREETDQGKLFCAKHEEDRSDIVSSKKCLLNIWRKV